MRAIRQTPRHQNRLPRAGAGKESLANIIENYAQVVEDEEEDQRQAAIPKLVFPRSLVAQYVPCCAVRADGAGQRYLIQHSAGSGKSNTIAWLAHQLVELKTAADAMQAQFVRSSSPIGVLDTQIHKTIKGYDHVASILGHSDNAARVARLPAPGQEDHHHHGAVPSSSTSWATWATGSSRC